MRSFRQSARQIAQYRVCLERDTTRGIIPADCYTDVDSCYEAILNTLESARVELEGAGPRSDGMRGFHAHSVAGCTTLAGDMFRAMYRVRNVVALRREAAALRREARRLMERLWLRIGQAA